MKTRCLLFLMIILGTLSLHAQDGHRKLREGDRAYEAGTYDKAEESYRAAILEKNSAQGNYNLGNAAYQQGDYEEAARRFEEAARLAAGSSEQAYAYHNLGNTYYQQGEFDKAAEAYKNALRRQPNDLETKFNLAKAMQQQQMQQPWHQHEGNEKER